MPELRKPTVDGAKPAKAPSSNHSSVARSSLAERLQHVVDDRRGNHKAIPIDLGCYLNELQLLALHSLESFGWHIWFVRRPLFMEPVIVVINPESNQHAVLEDDGSVNLKPHFHIRH